MLTGEHLGRAIEQAIILKGISKADVARDFGVKPPSVTGWVKTGRIGKDRLWDLMEYFSDVVGPEHWGLPATEDRAPRFSVAERPQSYGAGNVRPAPPQDSSRRAPVISWVAAGEWSEAVDIYQPGYADDWEPVPETAGQHAFWLEVVGDSMTSPQGLSIPEGYLILVDPDAEAVSGKLVVAKLEDTQEVTFKKLVIDAGQKYLKPLNPAYRTIQINGNCRVVGVVTEVKLKL